MTYWLVSEEVRHIQIVVTAPQGCTLYIAGQRNRSLNDLITATSLQTRTLQTYHAEIGQIFTGSSPVEIAGVALFLVQLKTPEKRPAASILSFCLLAHWFTVSLISMMALWKRLKQIASRLALPFGMSFFLLAAELLCGLLRISKILQ